MGLTNGGPEGRGFGMATEPENMKKLLSVGGREAELLATNSKRRPRSHAFRRDGRHGAGMSEDGEHTKSDVAEMPRG